MYQSVNVDLQLLLIKEMADRTCFCSRTPFFTLQGLELRAVPATHKSIYSIFSIISRKFKLKNLELCRNVNILLIGHVAFNTYFCKFNLGNVQF